MISNSANQNSTSQRKFKALLDADVMLEAFIDRNEYIGYVENLLEAAQEQQVELSITEWGFKKISSYLGASSLQYGEEACNFIRGRLENRIIPVTPEYREQASQLPFRDFESAIEHVCAVTADFDAIITQNPSNFDGAKVPIWTVQTVLDRLRLEAILKEELYSEELLPLENLQADIQASLPQTDTLQVEKALPNKYQETSTSPTSQQPELVLYLVDKTSGRRIVLERLRFTERERWKSYLSGKTKSKSVEQLIVSLQQAPFNLKLIMALVNPTSKKLVPLHREPLSTSSQVQSLLREILPNQESVGESSPSQEIIQADSLKKKTTHQSLAERALPTASSLALVGLALPATGSLLLVGLALGCFAVMEFGASRDNSKVS